MIISSQRKLSGLQVMRLLSSSPGDYFTTFNHILSISMLISFVLVLCEQGEGGGRGVGFAHRLYKPCILLVSSK